MHAESSIFEIPTLPSTMSHREMSRNVELKNCKLKPPFANTI